MYLRNFLLLLLISFQTLAAEEVIYSPKNSLHSSRVYRYLKGSAEAIQRHKIIGNWNKKKQKWIISSSYTKPQTKLKEHLISVIKNIRYTKLPKNYSFALKKMIKKGLFEDINNTELYNPYQKNCTDKFGKAKFATTTLQRNATICFDLYRISDAYLTYREILALFFHEFIHHFGYIDANHKMGYAIFKNAYLSDIDLDSLVSGNFYGDDNLDLAYSIGLNTCMTYANVEYFGVSATEIARTQMWFINSCMNGLNEVEDTFDNCISIAKMASIWPLRLNITQMCINRYHDYDLKSCLKASFGVDYIVNKCYFTDNSTSNTKL